MNGTVEGSVYVSFNIGGINSTLCRKCDPTAISGHSPSMHMSKMCVGMHKLGCRHRHCNTAMVQSMMRLATL